VENLKSTTTARSVPVEAKPSAKKGPSLEKLLSAWKAAETETRRKKEAELAAAHKVHTPILAYRKLVEIPPLRGVPENLAVLQ